MTHSAEQPSDDVRQRWREVRYRHTSNLPGILRGVNCSLLVSTYQASVGRHDEPLAERFREAADSYVTLERDVAAARQRIADERLDVLLFTALAAGIRVTRRSPWARRW